MKSFKEHKIPNRFSKFECNLLPIMYAIKQL